MTDAEDPDIDSKELTDSTKLPTSRRSILGGLAALGLLGGAGAAEASDSNDGVGTMATTLEYGKKYTSSVSKNQGLWLEPGGASKFGLVAASEKSNGKGVVGRADSGNLGDVGIGVFGKSASPDGSGVRGENTATSGFAAGVKGVTNAPTGTAVKGVNNAKDGLAFGAQYKSFSSGGRGFLGIAEAKTGATFGAIGKSRSISGVGFEGNATRASGSTVGVRGKVSSPDGQAVVGVAQASNGATHGVVGKTNSSGGFGLYTPDDAKIEGNLEVKGTKNFVQAVQTPSGTKEVRYTAVEAGTPHTEVSDVAEMDDGRATVELPEHFSMVTSEDEPLAVQVTPYAKEPVQPQVVEQSTDELVVEDFGDGPDDYTFAYTVKGVREGFEDEEIIRD